MTFEQAGPVRTFGDGLWEVMTFYNSRDFKLYYRVSFDGEQHAVFFNNQDLMLYMDALKLEEIIPEPPHEEIDLPKELLT